MEQSEITLLSDLLKEDLSEVPDDNWVCYYPTVKHQKDNSKCFAPIKEIKAMQQHSKELTLKQAKDLWNRTKKP